MKHKFIIFLLITIVTRGYSQIDRYSQEKIDSYIKSGWKYSNIDSCFIEYEQFDTLYSKSKKEKVVFRNVGVSDSNTKTTATLIDSNGNSINLFSCLSHDWPCSITLFSENCEFLIFQTENQLIKIFNLKSSLIDFEVNGFNCTEDFKSLYDTSNNIFFYFSIKNNDKTALNMIDLNRMTTKELNQFNCRFDMECPIISFNSSERILTIKLFDCNLSQKSKNGFTVKY